MIFPVPDHSHWGKVNSVISLSEDGSMNIEHTTYPPIDEEFKALLDAEDLHEEEVVSMSEEVTFRVFRGVGDAHGEALGKMVDYTVEMDEGMVVLDVIHRIQAEHALIYLVDGTAKQVNVALVALKLTECLD